MLVRNIYHLLVREINISWIGHKNETLSQARWFVYPSSYLRTPHFEDFVNFDVGFGALTSSYQIAGIANGDLQHMADKVSTMVEGVIMEVIWTDISNVFVYVST